MTAKIIEIVNGIDDLSKIAIKGKTPLTCAEMIELRDLDTALGIDLWRTPGNRGRWSESRPGVCGLGTVHELPSVSISVDQKGNLPQIAWICLFCNKINL